MSSQEMIFHPTTQQFLPLHIFTEEANQAGYTYWTDYLEYLDSQMDDGNEEEEEEENIEDVEKKKRIEEMRNADAKESNQSLIYSRECQVCLSSNPLSRSIFIICGHWSCLPCAETLENEGTLSCPFCRKTTGWVRMIERSEEKIDPTLPSSPSSSIESNDEDSSVLHPITGEIISFNHLRQEATMRGFEDPLVYLEVTYEAFRERVEQGLAQLKKVESQKLWYLGFSRVLMTMDILIFHTETPLAPDDVTSKTDFAEFLGPRDR